MRTIFLYILSSICEAFQEINRIAVTAPLSTKEMIELGEYMLHVKNKRMVQLNVSFEYFYFIYLLLNGYHMNITRLKST